MGLTLYGYDRLPRSGQMGGALEPSAYDPGLAPEAAKLWKAIQRRLETRRPPDPEEVYSTSLLLVSTGDLATLPQLFERARDDWKRSRGELRTPLPTRSPTRMTITFQPTVARARKGLTIVERA